MTKTYIEHVKEELSSIYCSYKLCSYVDDALKKKDEELISNYGDILLDRYLRSLEDEFMKNHPFQKNSSLGALKEQYRLYKELIQTNLINKIKAKLKTQEEDIAKLKEEMKEYLLQEDKDNFIASANQLN